MELIRYRAVSGRAREGVERETGLESAYALRDSGGEAGERLKSISNHYKSGAGDRIRTGDDQLGKLTFYH